MENEPPKEMRIFCHEHGKVFTTQANTHISCSISGHTLARDFPRGEIWEFCCDCGTFSRSKLGEGETARKECPVCDRQIVRRYLCGECAVVSIESDEPPAGKHLPDIDLKKGIRSGCGGCGAPAAAAEIKIHECEKIAAEVVSSREFCLFCKRKTGEDLSLAVLAGKEGESAAAGEPDEEIVCANAACARAIPANSTFCGFCGSPASPDDTIVVSRRRHKPRSVLPDSRCPNCFAVTYENGAYCMKCGQALEWPVTWPPLAETVVFQPEAVAPAEPPAIQKAEPSTPEKKKRRSPILFGCLAVILLSGTLIAIAINALRSSTANINAYTTPSPAPVYNAPRNTPSPVPPIATPYDISNSAGNINRSLSNTHPPSPSPMSAPFPRYFTRTYEGSINDSNPVRIRLERSGDLLSGEVIPLGRYSTQITLDGTIENDGSFEMTEYDDRRNATGRYEGQIDPGGSMEGTWSKPDGSGGVPFTFRQKKNP